MTKRVPGYVFILSYVDVNGQVARLFGFHAHSLQLFLEQHGPNLVFVPPNGQPGVVGVAADHFVADARGAFLAVFQSLDILQPPAPHVTDSGYCLFGNPGPLACTWLLQELARQHQCDLILPKSGSDDGPDLIPRFNYVGSPLH